MEIKSKYKSFNPLSFFSKLKRNAWVILIGLGLPVLLAIVFIFGSLISNSYSKLLKEQPLGKNE